MHDAYHIHGIHAPGHARRGDYAQILTWMLNYAPVTDNEDYARNYAGIIRRSLIANGPGVHLLYSSNKVSGEGTKCRGQGLLWHVRQKALQKMHSMRRAYLRVSVPSNTGGGHGALLSMGVYIAMFSVSETFS